MQYNFVKAKQTKHYFMNTELNEQQMHDTLVERAKALAAQDKPIEPERVETPEDATPAEQVLKEEQPEALTIEIPETPVTDPVETEEEEEGAPEAPEVRTWLDGDDEPTDPKAPVEVPEEIKAKVESYEKVIKDPFVEAYLAEIAAGGDMVSFIEKVSPEKAIKIDGMSNEDIHKTVVSRYLSAEELDMEMEHFNSLSPYDRKLKVDQDKAEIEKINTKIYDKLGSITKVGTQAHAKSQEQVNAAIASLDKLTSDLKDMNYRGVKLTEDKLDKIKDHVKNVNAFRKADGSYDIKEAIQYAIFKLYGKDLEKQVRKEGEAKVNAAKKEVIDAVTRPSKNATGAPKGTKLTQEQELKRAEAKLRQGIQSLL